jgi:hypothetical protein
MAEEEDRDIRLARTVQVDPEIGEVSASYIGDTLASRRGASN